METMQISMDIETAKRLEADVRTFDFVQMCFSGSELHSFARKLYNTHTPNKNHFDAISARVKEVLGGNQ